MDQVLTFEEPRGNQPASHLGIIVFAGFLFAPLIAVKGMFSEPRTAETEISHAQSSEVDIVLSHLYLNEFNWKRNTNLNHVSYLFKSQPSFLIIVIMVYINVFFLFFFFFVN